MFKDIFYIKRNNKVYESGMELSFRESFFANRKVVDRQIGSEDRIRIYPRHSIVFVGKTKRISTDSFQSSSVNRKTGFETTDVFRT